MSKWITGSFEANAVITHYLRTGGDKPPIILLHGLLTNGACWTPLARKLEEDYDVIMPDARGHGNSSAPVNHGYNYNNLATDVLNLIKTLELTTPVLLGHSMGGMTAALVASQNPKLLRGLILADPTFLTPQRQREVHESDITTQHRQILNQPKEDFLAEIRSRHSHRSRELVELLAQARLQNNINAFEILIPPNPNYMELVSALDVPSLLIIGDTDSVVSPVLAAELASLNQCIKVTQIAKASHGIPYDQPDHFAVVIKFFLDSLST